MNTRRWQVAGGVAAALVLLLIGYGVGVLTPSLRYPGDSSPEAGFARDMSEHHAQAVEIGMIAYRQASRPELRTLGGDVALTQQAQIGTMNEWLRTWGLSLASPSGPMSWMPEGQRALNGNLMPGMATGEEVAKLRAATGKPFDILFCQYLLRHHLGGIHMIDGLLAEHPRPEVAELAETMKRNQSGEIQVLTSLLTELGAKPLPG